MDAFFASVEQVRDPSLVGKPVIVGGAKDSKRGVVSTASYEAREYGVHSAMPIAQARKLCPNGIYIGGHFDLYKEASDTVREILGSVSPVVQMASIDEAYVDVSGSQKLYGGDDEIATYLKRSIFEATQLPCTIAISSNKLVSKVGSDEAKPDGYLRVPSGGERAFFAPLPIRKLPGFGPKVCERLSTLGIETAGELADAPESDVRRAFGAYGFGMQQRARGISNSEVVTSRVPKSMGRETTFQEDIADWTHVEQVLSYLTERAMGQLRAQGMEGKCITLKVRYRGFDTHTFSETLPDPTCVDSVVHAILRGLCTKAKQRRDSIRLIGMSISSLTHNQHQLHLFGHKQGEKWERALGSVDRVRSRHGFDSMRTAKSVQSGRTRRTLRDAE